MSSDRNSPAGSDRPVTTALYERVSTWIRRVRSKRGGTVPDGDPSRSGEDGTVTGDGTGAADSPSELPDGGSEAAEDRDGPLSTEERILLILQQSGRTRQSELVERLDWSKATVSRRLSRMEEAGHVSRLTVGREKIVALPEDGFGTPPSFDGPDGGPRDDAGSD